jgi:S-DNA-T family DNA segregation ATPase FtsK/SpoIIIE
VRRRREGRTLAERMAKELHAQGEHDKAALLVRHMADERQRRHERMRARAQMLIELARNAHWLIAAAVLCMLVFGIVLGDPAWPFRAAHALAVDFRAVVTWGARIGVIAVPLAVLAVLHETGRRSGLAPQWARTAADADVDAAIDELTITTALANLRIPQVRDYLKMGVPLQFVTSCRQEGRGTYAEIRLPNGLPAAELAKAARRERLAAGLYRHTKEVWPTTGDDNSVLKLWIADKGALDEGAGPYPLLAEGFTDVFKGLPFGRTLRGDPARIPVIGRNTLCGGAPEQGKSNGARVVACGYTLDISTELRIYVPDANFDFERFKPRCSSYVMGAEDEWIEQIGGELEELKEELQKRGQLLIDAEAEEVTFKLAHAGIGLHPVFVLLEEAHVAIQHRKFGKGISQLLIDIVKLDRKRGVHLMLSTQAPTKDSMPRDVTRNCTNGIAFHVGDHVANDALLGQGAHRSGHRATDLISGEDRGTALCKGFSGERSELVQVHRVQGRAGNDQVTPIVNRALAAMAEQGRGVPGTERGPLAIVSRDLLADLVTVLAHRGDRVRVADLPPMLRNLAKSWGPYRALTGKELLGLLTAEGVRTTNTANVRELDPAELHRVIGEREDGVS